MRTVKLAILLGSLFFASLVLADEVPVIDAYQNDAGDTASTTATRAPVTLSTDQRVVVLERQVANLNRSLAQMSNLQQQLQDLQGQLDSQKHDIKVLQDQVRSQYQDLDQRL